MFYIAPDKTASRRFEPNGIYFGIVKRIDANLMAWVEIPRLVPGFDFGPVNVAGGPTPKVGDRVGCVFVENRADDLVVIGVLQDTDAGPFLPLTQCLSTDRPAAPREGELIWETNTDQLRVWTGATWLAIATGTSLNPDNVTVEVAAGVLRVKDGGIGPEKLAATVAGTGLAHDPVNGLSVNAGAGLQIQGDAIRISSAAAGDGLTGGSGNPLAVNVGTGLEIVSDAVRIAAAAAGDGLTGGGGSALAVNPGTGLEISADTVRIAAAAAGDGLTGGGGSALAVNPDNATLEISADAVRVKDLGITRPKMIYGDGDNLIVDPLFELSTVGTTPHALVGGGGTWDFFATTKRAGTHSLRHQSTGQTVAATAVLNGTATSRLFHVPASQGETFTFEVQVQPTTATHNSVNLGLRFYDSAGSLLATSFGITMVDTGTGTGLFVSAKNAWNTMRVVAQAPANTTWVVPLIQVNHNSKTGTLLFDSAYLRRTVTASVIDPSVERGGFRNVVMNGDFRVNQRRLSSVVGNAYLHDRWLVLSSGATVTYSTQAFTPGSPAVAGYESPSFARINVVDAAGAGHYAIFRHPIEDVRTLAGETVTISFWAKTSGSDRTLAIELERFYGTGGSPSAVDFTYAGQVFITGIVWRRVSVTVTLPTLAGKTIGTDPNTSALVLNIWLSAGSNFNARSGSLGISANQSFDIWGVQVERGPVATPFEQRPYGLELEMCRRYYQQVAAVGATGNIARMLPLGFQVSTTTAMFPVIFSPVMRVAPQVGSANAEVSDDVSYSAAVSTIALQNANGSTGSVVVTHGAAGAQYRPCILRAANNTTAYVEFNAEF